MDGYARTFKFTEFVIATEASNAGQHENGVREDHPLRTIKWYADQALDRLSEPLDEMYNTGRPPISPERLPNQ